jgi:hypothetical protein
MRFLSVLLLAVVCTGCGGYGSKTPTAPQPGVAPTISELSPDNVPAGTTGLTLTVNGSSFAAKATVGWNGTQQPTMFVTAKQLVATIPDSALAAAGTVSLTVTNPGTPGTGGIYGTPGTESATSQAVTFTIE